MMSDLSEEPVAYNVIDWDNPYNGVVLKRREHSYSPRCRVWYDPATGTLVYENGSFDYFDLADGGYGRLLNYLERLDAPVRPHYLMVCGGSSSMDTPSREDLEAPAQCGWTVRMRYDEEKAAYLRAHVSYTRDEQTIELRLTAEWFGELRDALLCCHAWRALEHRLRLAFDSPSERSVRLISTPGRTGMDLLERSLPRHKSGERAGWSHEYPCLSEPLQQLLHRTNGQGRMELIDLPKREQLDGLYCLDGRWMYAACVTGLPSGPVTHDTNNECTPHVSGFYRVSGRVPRGWNHIGLLPQLVYRGEEREREWPRRGGARFSGWVTSAELALALEQGWAVEIHERILWPEPVGDPAKQWITKLRAQRELAEKAEAIDGPAMTAVKDALRSIVLMTIGFWHRQSGWEYGTQPATSERIPAGAELLSMRGGRLHWRRPTVLHDPQYCHPEWSATVWGRARARLARAALNYPLASLVALRTDALWLDFAPEVVDDGKPGTFRLKGAGIAHSVPAPHEEWELRSLMTEARA